MSDVPQLLVPLPIAVLRSIQRLQRATQEGLRQCHLPGTKELDEHKALEIFRSTLIEELNLRLKFYGAMPKFEWEWTTDILTDAVWSVLACFPQNAFVMQTENGKLEYESNRQFIDDLVLTGWQHLFDWRLLGQKFQNSENASIPNDPSLNRRKLVDAYRAAFPQALILDICWATRQHYSEWKRWLRFAVKDGSAPDRAFRAILTSGKRPSEYRKQPRPHGWK